MNPTSRDERRNHSHVPNPFDAHVRQVTCIIPAKLRGVVLISAAVALFPVLMGMMVLDILTHDMPLVRRPFEKVGEKLRTLAMGITAPQANLS